MIQMRELNFFECRCLASIQVVSYRESRKLFFGVVDFHVKIVFEWLIRVNRFACHISMNIYRKCIPPFFYYSIASFGCRRQLILLFFERGNVKKKEVLSMCHAHIKLAYLCSLLFDTHTHRGEKFFVTCQILL